MKIQKHTLTAIAGLALTVGSANAALTSQFGILDLAANGGVNPNTGAAWQAGDQYRLAFHTDGTINGVSNDPTTYDNFATAQANASTLGNGNITTSTGWTAMVYVNTQAGVQQGVSPVSNPRVRSGTVDVTGGSGVGGAGVPVYAMDGMTAIARNNADIYNSWSNPFASDAVVRIPHPSGINSTVHYSPFLDQFGGGDSGAVHGANVWTGGFGSAVNPLGTNNDSATDTRQRGSWGSSNANRTGRVWNRFQSDVTSSLSVYALSDLLTVSELVVIPEPSTTALLGLGGLALILRRRK